MLGIAEVDGFFSSPICYDKLLLVEEAVSNEKKSRLHLIENYQSSLTKL